MRGLNVINKPPLVSVIVATYNQEKYVEKSIRSILSQTYSNLEIIVSDDASQDNTQRILKKLADSDSRIKLFLQTKNLGITDNYNYLANQATGKYISWFSGDDIMVERKLELQVEALEDDEKASFCHHAVTIIDAKTERIKRIKINTYKNNITFMVDILRDFGVSGSMSIVCRRSLLNNPVFEPSIRVASDWLQMMDIAAKSYGIYLPYSLCFYRKDIGYNAKDPTKYENDFLKTMEIIHEKYANKSEEVRRALEDARNTYLIGAAFRQLMIGEKEKAKLLLRERRSSDKKVISMTLSFFSYMSVPIWLLLRLRALYGKIR